MDLTEHITNQILCAISLLVVFANVLESVLLLKTRKRWHNAQILLFNLAIADATLGLSTTIRTSLFLADTRFVKLYKTPVLKIVNKVLLFGNIYGSSLIVILISIDRWIAVKWPLKYRIVMTKKRICIGIGLSWIFGSLTVSGVLGLSKIKETYGWTYCAGTVLIVETLVIGYLYGNIFSLYRENVNTLKSGGKTLKASKKKSCQKKNHSEMKSSSEYGMDNISLSAISLGQVECKYAKSNNYPDILQNKVRGNHMSDKEKRLLKFCLAIVFCFLFSYMPAGTVWSFVLPHLSEDLPQWLESFIQVNVFCGSLWNPFLYFLHQYFSTKKLFHSKTTQTKTTD